jgi:type IV pilus assembly protein PilW
MRQLHLSVTRQRGLTLVEFMVSIGLGMLLLAAIATLIADQSGSRAEVERIGRLIENGRYATQTLTNDLQMAGYWGELSTSPAAPAAIPNPCSATVTDLTAAMGTHVQGISPPSASAIGGYNATTSADVVPACITNHRAGTDILVVRRLDPDSSEVEVDGVTSAAKLKEAGNADRVFLQTGLTATGTSFTSVMNTGGMVDDATVGFILKKKDKLTIAKVRKVVVRIYYIANCSVCSGANADTTPTLKMKELTSGPTLADAVSVAEGIENMQIDYGVDADADGAPEGADVDGTALNATGWSNVVSARVHLLVRGTEKSAGHSDTKTYVMGTAGTTAATNDGYKRHLFIQSVRVVNPSSRRSS